MDEFKKNRTQYRRLFTKACNEFDAEEAWLSDEDKLLKLKVIEEKALLMIETEYKVRNHLCDENISETECDAEFDQSEIYIDRWRVLGQKLKKLSSCEKEDSVSVSSANTSQKNTLLRYPKIRLPSFNGDIRNWLGFWGQFQKIDKDSNLDLHDKFSYLSQSMVKGSIAEDLIKSFPPGGDSYEKALNQLKSRFGKEELLIQIYVRDLLALVLQRESAQTKSLRVLYDLLETKLRALESLGVTRDKYACMLFPLIESSLPQETLRAWERCRATNRRTRDVTPENELSSQLEEKNDLRSILDFLQDEVEAEERIILASQSFDCPKVKSTSRENSKLHIEKKNDNKLKFGNRAQVATAADLFTASREQKLCIFCGNHHDSNDCIKAGKIPLKERELLVGKSHCCFLCLKTGHQVRQCNVKAGCANCGRRHHILLCRSGQPHLPSSSERVVALEETPKQDSALANISMSPKVMLQTLIIIIRGNGKSRKARAIFDSASQRSYILKDTAKEMKYEVLGSECLKHALFGGKNSGVCKHEVFKLYLTSANGNYNCNFEVLSQPVICETKPPTNELCIKELCDLNIHIEDDSRAPIEILIGADVAGKLMTGGYKLLPSGLAAIETKLGWTLMGKNSTLESRESTALLVTSMICNDTCISNLWSLETIGILDPSEKKTQDELHAAAKEHFLRTVRIDDEGRFIVDLPWLSEHPPLPENFELALKRLNNTVKNLKAKNLYEDYDLVFKEWEKEGIIEEVPYNEIQEPSHYLPHRPVVKENSTTRIRPVFDASAKSRSSPSLNDCLEKGMNLMEFIPSILTRFRMYKIGVTADICKAFLQIRVSERDKNYLRFLWYNDKSELKYFRHCRVIFGASCSPFLLGSVVQYHLESALEEARVESSKYPVETVEELANSFYVDNCLVSVKDEAQLHKFMQAATEILMERKFELRGWEYSDSRCQVSEPTNVLGMMWDRGNDTLSLKLSHDTDTSSMKISKRSILSAAHKTFDPLGIVCPVTLLPKLLLQRLWECKLTWDQEVDTNTEEEFLKWLKNLETLKELKITRWLQCEYVIDSLHFFCDASKSAYSAVVFIKICLNDSVAVHLLRAKSRIAPCGKKETTIARLELLGATILARLSVEVLKEFKKEKIVFWTDSTTVLSWLRREGPWGVFVQNRVQEIRSLTPLNAWRFVPGSLNPADLPSRGCSARQLLSSKWWEGPQWLYFSSEEWPKDEFCVDEEEIQSERKRGVVSSMVNVQCTDNIVSDRFSSYTKTIRTIGWIYRFYHNISSQNKIIGELTTDEYNRAEIALMRQIQSEQFHEDNRLQKLQTFKDKDGLLRLQTRLFDCEETEEFKSPILLPSKHKAVLKMVTEEHKKSFHAGLSTLLVRLREKYWILGVRKLAKQVISNCVICKRHTAKPLEVPFAPLPRDRVTHAGVFEVSGADYAGPLYLRSGEKAWIILFTCAVYRAVHFELVKSMSTESFILALRRFVARRGRIAVLYTDNGMSFVGTNNVLKTLDWNKISSYSTTRQISWKFIPPTAAWWGGWWERMVGMLKGLLRKMLGKSSVNYEELSTILCDCEAIINSRPLTYISSSPDQLMPLTPAMFLVSDNCTKIENADLDVVDRTLLTRRSKYLQKLREDLRQRFRNEYFALLINQGYRKVNSLEVGDIVLIGSDGSKRNDWPLGVVIKIYPGADGHSRVARVKTQQGESLRPFQRLYPLELSATEVSSLKLLSLVKETSEETTFFSGTRKEPGIPSDVFVGEETSNNTRPLLKETRYGRKIRVPERLKM